MRILVTNDDGIHSPGLTALAQALSAVGEVWIVAPDRERTAVAHAVTLHKPLRVHRLAPRMFSVNGTPVGVTMAADAADAGIPVGVGSEGPEFKVEAVATMIAPKPSSVATHQTNAPSTGTI